MLLLQAAAEKGTWLAWVLAGGAVLTSLLTLYVMMLVWAKGFLRDRADAPDAALVETGDVSNEDNEGKGLATRVRGDAGRLTYGMVASTAMLVVVSTSLTFVAGPMSGITGRAAETVQDKSVYRYAVLGDRADNPTRHLDQDERYQGSPDSLTSREEADR